jgi:hypothetical protein
MWAKDAGFLSGEECERGRPAVDEGWQALDWGWSGAMLARYFGTWELEPYLNLALEGGAVRLFIYRSPPELSARR